MRILSLLGLILSLTIPCRPQEWILAFERGLLTPRIVHALSDGGFLMGGKGVLMKLAPEGRIAWQFEYRGVDFLLWDILDIQPTSDRGYVATGRADFKYPDALVMKLDGTGRVDWARKYDARDWFIPVSICQTPDSGFILTGNVRWEEYSGWEHLGRFYNFLILKLTASGDVEWCWKLGRSEHDEAFWIESTQDGGFIIAGRTGYRYEKKRDMWVVKFTSFGVVEWQRLYGGPKREEALCIRQTADGGYVGAGWESSFGGPDGALILKLSSNGDIQWQRSFKRRDRPTHASSIALIPEAGYVVTGGGWEDNSDLWLLRISPSGNLEWQKRLDEETGGGYAVASSQDGRLLVGGWREIPVWWTDHWIYLPQPLGLMLTSSGEMNPCAPWQDFDMVIQKTDIQPETTFAITESYDIVPEEVEIERTDRLEGWEILCGGSDMFPIFPPREFAGNLFENRSLFFHEYLVELSWAANPENSGRKAGAGA